MYLIACDTPVQKHGEIASPPVSVAVKSWSIVGYVVLFYVHDGLIPSARSLLLAIWVWVVSVLTVIPVTVYQVSD